jgi:hypothetical protein
MQKALVSYVSWWHFSYFTYAGDTLCAGDTLEPPIPIRGGTETLPSLMPVGVAERREPQPEARPRAKGKALGTDPPTTELREVSQTSRSGGEPSGLDLYRLRKWDLRLFATLQTKSRADRVGHTKLAAEETAARSAQPAGRPRASLNRHRNVRSIFCW